MYSCVVPIYKRVELLQGCLDSLFTQTVAPAEVIVVSDHNSVEDEAQIAKIIAKFPSVKFVKNEGPRGANAARNAGARLATSEFIIFVDSDITFTPDAAEKFLAALQQNPDAQFSYSDFLFGGHRMRAQEFSEDALKKQNYICTMSMIRRAAFPGFDESIMRFQDWDLWLTMAEQGSRGVYIPEVLFQGPFGGTMSARIPSFAARHPKLFLWWPRVKKMYLARQIIVQKHHLAQDGRS